MKRFVSRLAPAGYAIIGALTLVALYALLPRGVLTYNLSASVPIGIYRAVPSEKASYITFCLKKEHFFFDFYEGYCSPDRPDGTPIIKRVRRIQSDGSIIVEGDIFNAIDSRILGPITQDQQRGYWHALLVL